MARLGLVLLLVSGTCPPAAAVLLTRSGQGADVEAVPDIIRAMPGFKRQAQGAAAANLLESTSEGTLHSLLDPWWTGNTRLQLVTVETRVGKAKRGRGGPTNIGDGHSWEGWTTKTKILSEWLDNHEDDGTLIIFADNQDMFFGGCEEMQFMMDYNFALASKPGARTVIGAERGCFDVPPPWNCDNVPETPTWAQRNWTVAASDNPHHVIYDSPVEKHGQMRYPNSGFIIGTVAVLRDLFKTALDDMKKEPLSQGRPAPGHAFTDQFFVTRYVLGHPDQIAFDYGSALVTNGYSLDARKLFDLLPMGGLHNRVTQKRQCFFHANGPAEETAGGIAKWQAKFEKA